MDKRTDKHLPKGYQHISTIVHSPIHCEIIYAYDDPDAVADHLESVADTLFNSLVNQHPDLNGSSAIPDAYQYQLPDSDGTTDTTTDGN
jgi:hypothetical protein